MTKRKKYKITKRKRAYTTNISLKTANYKLDPHQNGKKKHSSQYVKWSLPSPPRGCGSGLRFPRSGSDPQDNTGSRSVPRKTDPSEIPDLALSNPDPQPCHHPYIWSGEKNSPISLFSNKKVYKVWHLGYRHPIKMISLIWIQSFLNIHKPQLLDNTSYS